MSTENIEQLNRTQVYTTISASFRYKTCFLCDCRILPSLTKSCVPIFGHGKEDESNITRPLSVILSEILQHPLDEQSIHSKIVCKKCHQLCSEYDLMSKRVNDIRLGIINNYNNTAMKHNLRSEEETLPEEEHYETVTETGDASIPDGYSIEDVSLEMANVFENGTIIDTSNNNKIAKPKNILLIKSEKSPIFTMADIGDITQPDDGQESAYQTVILEQIHENEFDAQDQEVAEQFIITDQMDNKQEYFDANDDQMIEVSTNSDDKSKYHYVTFEDGVNDSIDEDDPSSGLGMETTIGDKEEHDESTDAEKDSMQVISGFNVKSSRNGRSGGSEQNKLFVRDGLNFQCAVCDPPSDVVYDPKTIAIHLRSDHNERIYVCSICGVDFRKRNPFNDHMEDHASESRDGVYECEICETSFADARQFRAHKKTHSCYVKVWSCKVCNKNYSSKNLLNEHMNMHTGERPYKCPHCVKDFASKYTLTAHMKIHYDRKRPYECKECGKSFFSNQNLTQHERTHTGVKEYECDVCHKKFGTPHNLDVHKIVHTGHKPFICRTCGKAFARRAEIKDHERTHTGERPYKCDMCDSSFAQRSNLMSHKRATHFNDKRYKCDTCSRSFKRRRLLEYHIKATHTGERPFKCEICNSTFVYPEHFKKHVRIHSGVKPFSCEVCGKAFNSRDNRNAHRYVHSDKKPYECLVCGIGFMRKPLLYAHMEAQNHLNDTIIINQPHIGDKKDDSRSVAGQASDENSINENDIVYLNMHEDDILEDDDDEYNPFEEEHIIDDGEIVVDGQVQFSNDATECEIVEQKSKQLYIRQQLVSDPGDEESDEMHTVIHRDDEIDANESDQLRLMQSDRDNVSWIPLAS